nr:MAK10-like protein [Tanacetum cinerariifolium]
MERIQFCNGICIDMSLLRVEKGFSGVETPLFENMLVVRAVDAEEEEIATEVVPPTPTSPSLSSPVIPSTPPHQSPSPPPPQAAEETANAAQQLEIIKLQARVKKLERLNKVKSSKLRRLKKFGTSQRVESLEDVENVFTQGRISVDMETNEGIELEVDQEKDAEIKGRQADTQAEIYNIDLDHSSKVLSMQEDTEVQEAIKVMTTAKLITEVVTAAASAPIPTAKPKVLKIAAAAPAVSKRKRKGVVIRDPKEELQPPAETPTVKDKELEKEHEEAYKQIDWNAAFDYVPAKETQYIKRYHGFKKKPQSESEARKNMISYLKNTEGYKMEFFKGNTYDQILLIFQARFDANIKFLFKTREEMEKEDEEIIKSINETPAQKEAKRRKLSEEAQEVDNLRGRLEIVQDEDDDVFVEAIPLAQKNSQEYIGGCGGGLKMLEDSSTKLGFETQGTEPKLRKVCGSSLFMNDPRDFAKPVKAISLPQDILSTSDRCLIDLENQVQCLMEAHLAPNPPVQVNKIASSCGICSGPHDTQYCMKNPEQAFVEYASTRTNETEGKWYTFKPEQNNLGD